MSKDCIRLARIVLVAAILCAALPSAKAQAIKTVPQNGARHSANAPHSSIPKAASKTEPFKIGENLIYEGKYTRLLLRGIEIADLNFKVVRDAPDDPHKYQFKAEIASKGALLKLISYNFLQKFDSTVDTVDFRALQTIHYDQQDKRVRNAEAVFDYAANKITYREIDPKNPTAPPRIITSPLEAPAQDLVSAIYFLRRQPLVVGQQFVLNLSDAGIIYSVPVSVTAREKQQTVLGNLWTLRIEPQIFGDKRLIADEGKLTIWITDDARHLPVRSQIQTSIGKIEIKLKKAENLQPLK